MTQRAVTVLLTAITGPYVANMGRAATATASVGTAAKGTAAKTGALGGALGGMTGKLVAGGGLLFAMKQGVDLLTSYEDALVGVGKTTGLAGGDLAALGDELSQLAVGIEGSAEDMLGIAQAAAQLGVPTDSIVEFTEVIANMASATDLTAQQAAVDMARLSNILGRPIEDVEALGSVIVELGNTMATTEPEILNLSMRLAAAGRTAGFTDAEVVGLAAAMSELGIEAEAGGTAMSRVMNEITRAVGTGSDELDMFAKTAGMSAEEFTEAWTADPAAALAVFLEGLGQLSDADRFGVMEELGLDAQRLTDVLLRTSAGAQGVADSFVAANKAEADNVAVSKEAATSNARLSVALEGLSDELKRQAREFMGNEEGAQKAAEGVSWLTRNLDNVIGPLRETFSPLQQFSDGADAAATSSGRLSADQVLLQNAARDTVPVLDDTAESAYGLADAQVEATRTNQDLADRLRASVDPVFALMDAVDNVADAQKDYNAVLKDSKAPAGAAAEASEKIYRSLVDVTDAALRVGPGGFNAAIARVNAFRDAGQITAGQANDLRKMIDSARGAAEDYAGNYRASLFLHMPAADQALLASARSLGSGRSSSTRFVPTGARADGGPVAAGGMYLVGEEGPELFSPSSSGHITSAGETSKMMSGYGTAVGGGGNTYITLHAPNYVGTRRDLLDTMTSELSKFTKRGGTLVANVSRQ